MSCLTLGEYPDPPCRGVYDLDEDDEVTDTEPPPFPELEWRFGDDEEQLGAPVNLLFVSCTKLASAFLDVYLEPEEPRGGDRFISCSVSVANEAKPAPDSAGAAAVTVVASKELANVQIFARTALCRVEEFCDHDDMRGPACHEFSKQIFEKLNLSKEAAVVVLTSRRKVAHNGGAYVEDDDDSASSKPIQRYLKSSSWGELPPELSRHRLKGLEPPNLIGGVAAAVLTEAEFTGRKCLLLVAYTDSEEPDSISLGGFPSSTDLLTSLLAAGASNARPAMVPPDVATRRLKTRQAGAARTGGGHMYT